jgi:hypothetical protein
MRADIRISVAGMGTSEFSELVQSTITAVSILGGAMAYMSGYRAARAMSAGDPPESVAARINEGLGLGFVGGVPLAVLVLIIEAWI